MFGFVNRDIGKGLVYNGDIKKIEASYKADEALKRYESINNKKGGKKIQFKTVEMEIYGRHYKITLPIVNLGKSSYKDFANLSDKLYDFLMNLSTWKMIDDVLFGLWQKILETYVIIEVEKVICFYKYKSDEIDNIKFSTIEDQAAIVMMKEYIDGYIADYDYNLKQGDYKKKIKLGIDYNIKIPGTDEDAIIKSNYTAALRMNVFGKAAEERMKELRLEELPPLLYERQYDLIKRMGHRTILTNIRGGGKSIFMVYAAVRFLLKSMPHLVARHKTIIFVGETKQNLSPIFTYFRKVKEAFKKLGDTMFNIVESRGKVYFMEGDKILGEVRFVTEGQDSTAVGDNCDFLIIDEVARISESTWDLIKPFVSERGEAMMLAATTMYKGVKKSWVYKYLAEYEKNAMKEKNIDKLIIDRYKELTTIEKDREDKKIEYKVYGEKMRAFKRKMESRYIGLRYTIDDNEKFTEETKERLKKEKLSKDPEGYFCEYYSRFSDEGKVFKFEKALIEDKTIKGDKYEQVVVAYDPALTSDMSACTVMGYNQYTNKIVLLEEHELNQYSKTSYGEQTDRIKLIMKKAHIYLENQNSEVLFAMDGTHPRICDVFIAKGVYPHFRCFFMGGNNIVESRVAQEMKVPKKTLVNISRDLFTENKIKIIRGLVKTVKHLENFYEIDKDIFEGISGHDDFVDSMMIGNFFIYHVLGYMYKIMKQVSDDDILKPKGDISLEDRVSFNKDRNELLKSSSDNYNNNLNYFKKFVY